MLSNDKNDFIEGIYNYCDRWCEKCTHTSRCFLFAREQQAKLESDDLDQQNQKFWDYIEDSLKEAHQLLEQLAKEQGISLDDLDDEPVKDYSKAEKHPASVLAKTYVHSTNDWFNKAEPMLESRGIQIQEKAQMGIAEKELEEEVKTLNELLEITRWYQHLIYVKIMRALQGKMDMRDNAIQSDANGSAKIALLSIDKSMGAWVELLDEFPSLEDMTLKVLAELQKLRGLVENSFPHAHKFKRPGFDE